MLVLSVESLTIDLFKIQFLNWIVAGRVDMIERSVVYRIVDRIINLFSRNFTILSGRCNRNVLFFLALLVVLGR